MELFWDFELKKALENHYSDQSALALDYGRQNAILENHLGYFMIEKMDFYAVHKGDYSFMDDLVLRNIIQSLFGTYTIAIETTQTRINQCETLKTRINKVIG